MTQPRLDQFSDFEGYGELPALDFKDAINRSGVEAFIDKFGTLTTETAEKVAAWCDEQNVPMTRLNLEVAYRELYDALPLAPEPAPQPPRQTTTHPLEGSLAAAPPTEEETAVLAKLRDDPSLNDHQRKARDEKLRRLAVASRNAGRSFRPGHEPTILV